MKYLSILFACISTFCFGQPDLWDGMPRGPHTVGFRVFNEFDKSRPALKEQRDKSTGRAMQVSVWYPANTSPGLTINVGDYLMLKGAEINFTSDKKAAKDEALKMLVTDFNSTGEKVLGTLFPIKMKSIDSKDKTGKFPVVIMTHSNAAGYSLLAELLASHGFIVATSPMTGTLSKEFDWQTTSGVETEIADLEYVMKTVQQNFNSADLNSVGVVGYSYGAMAAVAFSTRHNNVKAVVSLDGGIGSLWGGQLLSTLKDYDVKKINKPILHIWSDFEPYFDLYYIKSYAASDRYIVKAGHLEHNSFVTDGALNAILQNSPDKQQRIREHQDVCKTAVLFLNQQLNNQKADWAAIANSEVLKRSCENC